MSRIPFRLNAPGDFYVADGECISCALPAIEAPNLIGEYEGKSPAYHCYFKKQPENDEELREAIDALHSACCSAVRYKGTDPDVIDQITLINCEYLIDCD